MNRSTPPRRVAARRFGRPRRVAASLIPGKRRAARNASVTDQTGRQNAVRIVRTKSEKQKAARRDAVVAADSCDDFSREIHEIRR
jgi:hypothetical protein